MEDFWLIRRKHAPTSTASFLCGEGDAWRKSTALRTCPYGFRALERDDGSWEIYEATTSHNHAMKSSATTTNAGSSTTATAHQQLPGQPSLAFIPRAEASSIAHVPTVAHSHGSRLSSEIRAQEPKQPTAETFGSAATSTTACRHELEPPTFARRSVDNSVSDFFHGLDNSAPTQQAQEVSMLLNDIGVETSADLVNLALLSPPIRKAFFDELHRRVRDHFTLVAPLLQRLFSSLESRA
ncbi:hypothetical protein JCM10908_000838 [Rhodotorula pacifica]|uniref:uncharacterized protein n=1 Tax=Rhodotorula pacifica TaxID=1495444 RepID=UPI00317419D6